MLRAYLLASRAIPLLAAPMLRRRLSRGREDPARWREKLGEAALPRPSGQLVWLHAVGLGEVLALRGLILEMAERSTATSFLVTSTARSSAKVIAANLPPRTCHQFLPLDAPRYLQRFLDHWRPDLSVWAEQEVWPGAVAATAARGIPLAMVNARITAESHAKRTRLRGLYADVLSRFVMVTAQDEGSAARLVDLGARGVQVTGSLKLSSPPLAADAADLARLREAVAGRRVWVAASTHPGDEAEALSAQARLRAALLILVPRDVGRADGIARGLAERNLTYARRSAGEAPGEGVSVFLADSYGELGLWYRLADTALIGGCFDRIGGHNPWEAAALGCAVLHGPDVSNFVVDYAQLAAEGAAIRLAPGDLAAALSRPDLRQRAARGEAIVKRAQGSLAPLAEALLTLASGRE